MVVTAAAVGRCSYKLFSFFCPVSKYMCVCVKLLEIKLNFLII